MQEDLIQLSARVQYILFRNEKNYYTVMKVKVLNKGKSMTLTGYMDTVEEDEEYIFYGDYVDHPVYGVQFAFVSYEKQLPQEKEGIIKYLSSSLFEGIGKKTATMVVETLGENCIEDIRNDPSILDDVPISLKQRESIRLGMRKQDSKLSQLVQFCTSHGVPSSQIQLLYKKYGDAALEKIQDNPYKIIEEVEGFGFKTADKVAYSLGFSKDDPRRLQALLSFVTMSLCVRSGDSYVLEEILEDSFKKIARGIDYDFYDLLQQGIMQNQLVREEDRIYPVTQYQAESGIAKFIAHFPYFEVQERTKQEVLDALKQTENDLNITYDDIQKEAIISVFHNPMEIITGGPGTGKTTVVKAICHMQSLLYPDSEVVCAAPTGRASKRLKEVTDLQCSTIHSLLGWDIDSNTFAKGEDDPIVADLLIIDEFSMVDSWLFYNLVKASTTVRRICILGDEDQLPSVGPGCVLRDLISSNAIPYIRLKHIYRQKDGSDVITLAHQIIDGNVDLDLLKKDVKFFDVDEIHVQQLICQIVKDAIQKNYSMMDVQVISPMYKGNCGIDALNGVLQACFNPKSYDKREVKNGFMILREGDKVLQLKNQPDDGVFNGDIGIIEEIVTAEESDTNQTTVYVDFQGTLVAYIPENWNTLTLAYCISVHKAQGSEYPVVIMPFSTAHTIMLQKKLIYTSCTRCSKSLVLLGSLNAFIHGVTRVDAHERATTLQQRISREYVNHSLDFPF